MQRQFFLVFILLFSFAAHSQGDWQTKQRAVRKLEGHRDIAGQAFYLRQIDPQDPLLEHIYRVKRFINGLGITDYWIEKSSSAGKAELVHAYGLIDSTGHVLVPCIYDDLDFLKEYRDKNPRKLFQNNSFFRFERNDSVGIVDLQANEILKIAVTRSMSLKVPNHVRGLPDTLSGEINYCRFFVNGKAGIFSLAQKKVLIENQFDNIVVFGKLAFCESAAGTEVRDLESGARSRSWQRVHLLQENGPFLVYDAKEGYTIYDNIFQLKRSALNHDGVLEYFNEQLIVRQQQKMGVLSKAGAQLVEPVYEDIFFLGNKHLLVKRDHRWAIADGSGQLLSSFDYLAVEEQNRINFTKSMKLTNLNAGEPPVKPWQNGPDGYKLEEQLRSAYADMEKELSRRVLTEYSWYSIRSDRGFHLMKIDRDTVKLDEKAWDEIFLLPETGHIGLHHPGYRAGVRKGDQFGYTYFGEKAPEIKYQGIAYRAKMYEYDINGYLSSPYGIIKRGYIFYHYTKYVPFSNRRDRTGWKKWSKADQG